MALAGFFKYPYGLSCIFEWRLKLPCEVLKTFPNFPAYVNIINMAKAGFVHCPSENEPDVACCFFCLRELEGWEPEDNPWSEHLKRSPTCAFLLMNKDYGDLTVAEFFHLEKVRLRNYMRKVCHIKIEDFRDEVEAINTNLKKM